MYVCILITIVNQYRVMNFGTKAIATNTSVRVLRSVSKELLEHVTFLCLFCNVMNKKNIFFSISHSNFQIIYPKPIALKRLIAR